LTDPLAFSICRFMQRYVFSKVTDEIKVSVMPNYLEDHSEPSDEHYVWSYTVQVENLGDEPVQLMDRHWIIADGVGHKEEVKGEGVVGEQPVLKPKEGFRYTSGTSLHTPSGMMMGSYGMRDKDGKLFNVDVPAFSLDSPYGIERPN
jgi:ApaG protein